MINVLITGSAGFIGRNLMAQLREREDVRIYAYDLNGTADDFLSGLANADIIFHLAGINRPKAEVEFHTGNTGFTEEICNKLKSLGRKPKIMFSSSIQVGLDNPYAISKQRAEETLARFAEETGGSCVIYRLKNLFGKWCRPNYNSVTATFCYNIANSQPIQISDPSREIELTYIDDVVSAFEEELADLQPGFRFAAPLPSYSITLGELAKAIQSFRDIRTSLHLPNFSDRFIRALYATYLTYLSGPHFGYNLNAMEDERGSLAEFIKSRPFGQIFISRTKPGITRGNHYHHTKTEKFLVVEGEAVIRFRRIDGGEVIEHHVRGEEYRVLDIPPGYVHSLENTGSGELVTLFWASEIFDPEYPDTYFEQI